MSECCKSNSLEPCCKDNTMIKTYVLVKRKLRENSLENGDINAVLFELSNVESVTNVVVNLRNFEVGAYCYSEDASKVSAILNCTGDPETCGQGDNCCKNVAS